LGCGQGGRTDAGRGADEDFAQELHPLALPGTCDPEDEMAPSQCVVVVDVEPISHDDRSAGAEAGSEISLESGEDAGDQSADAGVALESEDAEDSSLGCTLEESGKKATQEIGRKSYKKTCCKADCVAEVDSWC